MTRGSFSRFPKHHEVCQKTLPLVFLTRFFFLKKKKCFKIWSLLSDILLLNQNVQMYAVIEKKTAVISCCFHIPPIPNMALLITFVIVLV